MYVSRLKRIGFLLILGIILILLWDHSGRIVKAAAAPRFKDEVIEISGVGEVYKLEILYKVKKSTYKWSSSNEKVAKVSGNGIITTVSSGTAKIKCKIKYSSGKTMNLYCNVTVTIPATDIKITNASNTNGAHVMMVGETYNFDSALTPANSTDEVHWSLDSSDNEANFNSVRIDDSTKGIVTALRRGKIVLVATAAKEATAKSAEDSYVKDAIIIEVVGPSAEVISAEIVDSKTIKVVFGTEIRESTVINSDGKLSSNIEVARLMDSSGKNAADPGSLTAVLSGNMRTLNITAGNSFNGYYGITFTNGILTTEGAAIYKDYLRLSYFDEASYDDNDTDTGDDTDSDDVITDTDTDAPDLTTTTLDDNGMTNIITFSEKMDFSNLQVSNARSASNSTEVQPTTIYFLNNKINYNFSTDGKSILINLSAINSEDYNKAFTVTISGIKDISGNELKNGSIDVNIRTNTAPMAQARPISVIRTSYNTITATFNRSIRKPGSAYINNSGYYEGKVNPDNNKQVIYTISDYDASLTGSQTVSIGFWDSYNVRPDDNFANEMHNFNVYFRTESIRPVLSSYKFNSDQNILTLTYSENVSLYSNQGSLSYTMASNQYDDLTGYFDYSVVSTVNNVVDVMLKNITLYGNYTFTIPEGFVIDNYRNLSYSKTITINNGIGEDGTNKLAEPYSIHQSDVNHSIIYIEFADRLDGTTALDEYNYNISGASIEEIKLIKNSTDGAIVQLVLVKGSITSSGKYMIRINGIKGYNGANSEMADYSTEINLIENTDPALKSVTYDPVAKDVIRLTFTENITGNIDVNIQERSTGSTISNTVTVSGDTATITLSRIPEDGTHLVIYVLDNSITDLNGNESTINPVLYTFVNY